MRPAGALMWRAGVFVATNLDDVVVLAAFLADPTRRPASVVLGQSSGWAPSSAIYDRDWRLNVEGTNPYTLPAPPGAENTDVCVQAGRTGDGIHNDGGRAFDVVCGAHRRTVLRPRALGERQPRDRLVLERPRPDGVLRHGARRGVDAVGAAPEVTPA